MTQGKNLVSNEWKERFWWFSTVLSGNLYDSQLTRDIVSWEDMCQANSSDHLNS